MKKAHVFILAGQSNAVGVGFTKYLPEHFDQDTIDLFYKGFENISIWYVSHDIKSEGFVPTRVNCTEATKDTLGPEVGMAHWLSKTHPDEMYYIIKCAVGGSDLHNGWRSPSSGVPYCEDMIPHPANAIYGPAYQFPGWCFNACMKLLTESFEALRNQGYEPCVEAFCWMQGESDTHVSYLGSYMGWYDALLHDLKTTFAPAFDGCTFIDAGISQVWENYEQMNAQKKAYAKAHGHKFIDTIGAGLTTLNEPYEEPDTYHYDLCSIIKLGELFIEAWEGK